MADSHRERRPMQRATDAEMREYRMQCLELAVHCVGRGMTISGVMAVADELVSYVISGAHN